MHMSECLYRIGVLIKIGTVASKMRSLMKKRNLAFDNLRIRIITKHIILQLIRMKKVNTVAMWTMSSFLRTLHGLHQTKPK